MAPAHSAYDLQGWAHHIMDVTNLISCQASDHEALADLQQMKCCTINGLHLSIRQ